MLRLDRFLTLALFDPLARLIHSNGFRIPILMYHSVSYDVEQGIHPYYRVVTTPEVFTQHMALLADRGYQVIGLEEAVKLLHQENVERQSMPTRPVVITFDDGFRDFYTHAYPILQKYGFTATMFLPTGFISNDRKRFKEKLCLSWNEVRELHQKGISFGSHTITHPQLKTLPGEHVQREVKESKEIIENELGSAIESFSYPYAFPEEDNQFKIFLRDALRSCGYQYGVSTILGIASRTQNQFFLRRIPANSYDDMPLFKAKLKGAYDWLHKPQYLTKMIKRRLLHRITNQSTNHLVKQ
jgi:peptidoglycan/xylan/chitin deacetylase (PgdA/CDA1 family)